MNILLVVNPVSGDIDKDPFTEYAISQGEAHGHNLSVLKTTGKNDIENIRGEIEKFETDRLLSLGGDGNFILCCTAVEGMDIPVGLIPMGSANGLATELGIPKNYEKALEVFLRGSQVKEMDVICVDGDKFCAHLGDVGINAEIVKMYDEDENRGMTTYAKYLTRALAETEPFAVSVKSHSNTLFDGKLVMVGLGNCRQYGTGVYLTKDGNPFDGEFEIVLIHKMDFATILKKGWTVFNKEVAHDENTEVLKVSEATLNFEKPQQLQLDGEPQGKVMTLNLQLLKAHFPVVIAPDNSFSN